MDAITLLKQDHAEVDKHFTEFEQLGPRAHVAKERVVSKVIELLSVHAAIEETVFYPAVREEVESLTDTVLESLEEHHVVKWLLQELEDLSSHDERYDAKMTVLIENTRHHVEEEETEFFPQVRAAMSRTRLNELGDALAQAKTTAPTRPHR
jgi:hemerythrin superfamily protein